MQMFCDKARAVKDQQQNPEVVHIVKITVLAVNPDNIVHVDFGETEMRIC